MPRQTLHPGVTRRRIELRGEAVWQLRWTDPRTGKTRTKTFRGAERDSILAAQRQSAEVRALRGQPASLTLAAAVDHWLHSKSEHARDDGTNRTRDNYKQALDVVVPMLERLGVVLVEQIDRPVLVRLRAAVLATPNAAGTKNHRLRHTAAWLNGLRKMGLIDGLHSDTIGESLARVRADRTWPAVLTLEDCQTLLCDAVAHDSSTRTRTRLAEWVALMLLSGCRPGELRRLAWADVRWDDPAIVIRAAHSKSRRDRVVGLDVCPVAIEVLRTMHGRREHPKWVWIVRAQKKKPAHAPTSDDVQRWAKAVRTDVQWCYDLLRHTASSYVAALRGALYESQRHSHSIAVAERDYYGRVRIPEGVTTMEAAIGIEAVLREIVGRL